MIENQEELRTALEKNREQKELLSHLETLQTTKEDGALSEMSAQLEARQKHVRVSTCTVYVVVCPQVSFSGISQGNLFP